MCPASRASWMVWRERIILTPTPAVPSSNGTRTSITKANSRIATPRKLLCRIVMLLGSRSDARYVPRRFDKVGGGGIDGGIGIIHISPAKDTRRQSVQGETLDRDLHNI